MPDIPVHLDVSRRERQILDVLYACGRATAAEIQTALSEAPSYSAVHAVLRIVELTNWTRHS
jgi:BlaI family penicillinase repressor